MSCYLRHLGDVVADAGIELTKDNRKAVDRAIRRIVGHPDSDCPEVWREVKEWLADGRRGELVARLSQAFTA